MQRVPHYFCLPGRQTFVLVARDPEIFFCSDAGGIFLIAPIFFPPTKNPAGYLTRPPLSAAPYIPIPTHDPHQSRQGCLGKRGGRYPSLWPPAAAPGVPHRPLRRSALPRGGPRHRHQRLPPAGDVETFAYDNGDTTPPSPWREGGGGPAKLAASQQP